ncbi:MAG: hypothetical protein HY313_06345 [Acidobacteria bacterium]|nr:hypothetical protein [Acidobacteriota bacterium]
MRPILEHLSAYNPRHREARLIERLERTLPRRLADPGRQHIDAAISWIKCAQDVSGTGGVSWGYRARSPVRSRPTPIGWRAPYPETTGYIIPTFLRYADLTGDSDCINRARCMTEWLVGIQLPDGGFQGGSFGGAVVAPSTFVTGQVLFGMIASYYRFGDERYLRAALRAGDFLLDCLDNRGRFAKGYSPRCASGPKAYEVRTGWALAQLGEAVQDARYSQAASKIADYAISCQLQNGWFSENDLDDHTQPLTHTVAYVMEGLEGIGTLLDRPDCFDAVRRTLNSLVNLVAPDGSLPGRWRQDWTPAVDWICLTGSSQIAGVFLRMHGRQSHPFYLDSGKRLLGFVAYTQEIRGISPGLIGGIRGSFPFHGNYGQWCVLNWATKFFADSVMDYLALSDSR